MSENAASESEWPTDGIESLGACPVCGSPERDLLFEGLRDRIFLCAPGAWDMQRCRACGTGYLDPRPTPKTIHLAYRDYYTHDEFTSDQPGSRLGKIRQALGNGYRNRRFGLKLVPELAIGALIARLLPNMKGRIDAHYRFIAPARSADDAILDIGCGNGAWLALAREAGFAVYGVEPDPVAAAQARGQGVAVRERLVDYVEAGRRFQRITMNHVIEHVHDPVATLRMCFDLLVDGGELYIATPNIDALGAKVYGSAWRGLEPPRHLVLFTVAGSTETLAELGFDRIRLRPQHYVWKGLSAESERIRARTPEVKGKTARYGFAQRIRARLDPVRSEFITLTCRRPQR